MTAVVVLFDDADVFGLVVLNFVLIFVEAFDAVVEILYDVVFYSFFILV